MGQDMEKQELGWTLSNTQKGKENQVITNAVEAETTEHVEANSATKSLIVEDFYGDDHD